MARNWKALLAARIPSAKRLLLYCSLAGCYVSLVLGGVYASLGLLAPAPTVAAGDAAAAGQALGIDNAGPDLRLLSLVLMFMAITFLGSPRRQMGLALPRAPVLGMVTAFCLTLTGDMTVVYLQLLVPASSAEPSGTLAEAWRSQSIANMVVKSLTAGVSEEYLLLATPVGVVVLVCAGINLRRTAKAAEPLGYHLVFGYALAAGLLFIVPRSEMHAYQGRTSVLSAAVWTACHLAVYLYFKSVWPLIIAHTAYDFFVAGGWLGGALDIGYITCEVILLAVGVLAILLAGPWSRQSQSAVSAGDPYAAQWWTSR